MSTPTLLTLPPRPEGLRLLTDAEADRVNRKFPDTPQSLKHCLTCQGKKTFLWKGAGDQPATYECNCVDQRLMNRYFLHCNMGIRYQRLSWTDLDLQVVDGNALTRVYDYAQNAPYYLTTGNGLVLYGSGTGTGKTMMATLLLKRLLADGHDGYFTQFNDLIDDFTSTWGSNAAEERAWFTRRVRNAGVLVIDDVGRESKSRIEMVEAMFDQVIRARHDNCKPTIITTNKTPDEFKALYRSNIMSLLSETCETVHVTGPDYRPTSNQKGLDEARQGLTRPVVAG